LITLNDVGPFVLAALVINFINSFYEYPFRGSSTMPVAVATDVAELKKLKTLPADPTVEGPAGEQGWVKIRRLTYGEKMNRRSINSKMVVKSGKGKRDAETVIDAFNEKTELFDFANCIVDHNLTDSKGVKLDFRREEHVRALASHVAEEIQTYMDELNNFEQDDEAGNS
jgi:hypothetical protein